MGEKSPHTTEFAWKSFVAGGLAGCAAKTAIAPLDRVKILFQTHNPHFEKYSGSVIGIFRAANAIRKEFGFIGLFQGHSATILRVFPYAAIKYMTYEQYRAFLMPTKKQETSLRRVLAGSLAGVTSVFFTYPLDVLRVRLAFELKHASRVSLIQTAVTIGNEQSPFIQNPPRFLRPIVGLTNFYRGYLPSVYGIVPYAGMSFLAYETLKDISLTAPMRRWTLVNWEKYEGLEELSGDIEKPVFRVLAKMICGGLSGMIAQTCSYPLEMIRRQMQIAGVLTTDQEKAKALKTTLGTAKYIFKQRGFRGFFVGLSIGYIKVVPMFAVSFYSYEYLKGLFGMADVGMGSASFG